MITLHLYYWQLLILSPWLFFLGFVLYAGALNAWHPDLPIWVRVILIPPLLIFGLIDVAFNVTIGSILFLELPFVHGITFSQRLCYWFNTVGDYRKSLADGFAWLLNKFNNGHIK